MSDEMERVTAKPKSYVWAAVLTFVLYWCLGVPGLFANILFLERARKEAKVTGKAPAGLTYLWCLLVLGSLFTVGFIMLCIAYERAGLS